MAFMSALSFSLSFYIHFKGSLDLAAWIPSKDSRGGIDCLKLKINNTWNIIIFYPHSLEPKDPFLPVRQWVTESVPALRPLFTLPSWISCSSAAILEWRHRAPSSNVRATWDEQWPEGGKGHVTNLLDLVGLRSLVSQLISILGICIILISFLRKLDMWLY